MVVWNVIKKVFICMIIAIFILIALSLLPTHLLQKPENTEEQVSSILLTDETMPISKTYWNTTIELSLSDIDTDITLIQTIITQESVNLISFSRSAAKEELEDSIGILSIEIPVESMDDFLSHLQSIGKIDSIQTYTNEEALLSQDANSWIENLTIQENRYQDLMKECTNLDEIILIEKELSRIRVELDNWKVLEQQTKQAQQMTTINLQVHQLMDEESWMELIQKEFLLQVNRITMVSKILVAKIIGLVPYMLIGLIAILVGWSIFKKRKR